MTGRDADHDQRQLLVRSQEPLLERRLPVDEDGIPRLRRRLNPAPGGEGAGFSKLAGAYELVTGAYGFVHQMIRLFYNPNAVTWAEVGSEKEIHKAHESAMAAGHFMLSGDFFESHERYTEFFRLLNDPTMFRRYKALVIDRAEFTDTSCHEPRDAVFPMAG